MIKTFKNWIQHLIESKRNTYEYGCAMIYYDLPDINYIHSQILPEDVYTEVGDNSYGLEEEPHTTLLYGFHSDVDPNEVLDLCSSFEYNSLLLNNASCFNNEKYDVLKFDVYSSILREVNRYLTQNYEGQYTTNFPDYHPHCTIAYIKKGRGEHYAAMFKNLGYLVTPKKLVYSLPSGERLEREL